MSKVIELAIERLADGEVSPFFHDVAQVGDTIELRGPLGGHFLWPGPSNKPVKAARLAGSTTSQHSRRGIRPCFQ